jgi:signal transduction histidine kinase
MRPEDRREHFGPPWRHGRPHRWRGSRHDGPVRRATDDRLVGGVAAGVSAWTGVDVTIVRVGFVVASLVSGFGLAAYVLGWLMMPATGQSRAIASDAIHDRRGIALAAAVSSLLVVLLFLASALGGGWLGSLAFPLVVSAGGLVLIARNAEADEKAELGRIGQSIVGFGADRTRSRTLWRLVLGGALLVIGLATVASGHTSRASLRPLGGLVLVMAAIVVVLGPWWLRIARDLVVERQARVRAEERADMASRVHDSVLQTLALIQLHADEPQRVVQLARAQERELRSWLFDGRAPGSMADGGMTVAAGVRLIQQEIEATHGVTVEAITVGDCDLDEDLEALLAAAREATVNAVKWSGAAVVSLFAEVEPAQVTMFVRDRGRGFDPANVPADRKGLAESIHARMARRGGVAGVRSVAGEGTEVSLTMPRSARKHQQSRS